MVEFETSGKDESNVAEAAGAVADGVVGTAVGVGGSLAALSLAGTTAGLSAAGITSGLAAIGATVDGGMAAGVAITAAGPVVVAAALGYGGDRLVKWMRSE